MHVIASQHRYYAAGVAITLCAEIPMNPWRGLAAVTGRCPRMPATATIETRVQEDRDATLHVDGSLGPEGAFAFPAPHRNTCSFNVGHVAVVSGKGLAHTLSHFAIFRRDEVDHCSASWGIRI
jgi:hypothetical protein